jgi:coenzyme F420 hydrogenase subunit beta
MMKVSKIGFEESLENVVLAGRCTGCATCTIVCPLNCLEYVNGKPRLVKECNACGICAAVCPRYDFSQSALERFVFGREREPEEDFGIYRRIVIAQASDSNVLDICQDGGVVTALLTFALERGIIDGAAVSGVSKNKPFFPVPRLAATSQEVVECGGTRYSYSPNLLAFKEGVKQKRERLAFVGTPCQVQAIRKIQMIPLKKYANPLKLSVGLMCTECFTYEGLMEEQIQEKMGIKLADVKKMNIKGKIIVTTRAGDVKAIPLADAKQYTRKSCLLCPDFSSELADISVGGLGLSGWTFTIIRTEEGEELFENAQKKGILRTVPVEQEKKAVDLLVKLSQRKRRNSHAHIQETYSRGSSL